VVGPDEVVKRETREDRKGSRFISRQSAPASESSPGKKKKIPDRFVWAFSHKGLSKI
jgi:hypothetical protein